MIEEPRPPLLEEIRSPPSPHPTPTSESPTESPPIPESSQKVLENVS